MARWTDAAKRHEWTERLERFALSDLTVEAFCRQEGVSPPTFYAWRKKLAAGAAPKGPAAPTFAPLRITPAAAMSAAAVRMELANGVRLWLPAGDAQALAAAIAAAGQLPAAAGEETPC